MDNSDQTPWWRSWRSWRFGWLGAVVLFVVGHWSGLALSDAYDALKDELFPPDTPDPVAIYYQYDPAGWEEGNPFGGESYEWVFNVSGPRWLRPPPDKAACYERYKWAQGRAGAVGVSANTMRFRVTIQGNSDKAVLLQKITPVIHKRSPGVEGTYVACPVGGATANLNRVAVDLDRGTAAFQDGEGNPLPTTMLKFPEQDSEPIQIIATAKKGRYDWALRLDLIVGGELEPVFIPSEGTLLSTTGTENARTVHWNGRRWRPGIGPPVGVDGPTPIPG